MLAMTESRSRLMDGYSLEMTAKDVDNLVEAADHIPRGTRISITFLPGEELGARVNAAKRVRSLGFVPVPHISARRLSSANELDRFLDLLVGEAGADRAFIVAGDAATPMGPFADALAVISSGLLEKHGIGHVGIAGYPEGHQGIPDEALRRAMAEKARRIEEGGMSYDIVTQFAFDEEPVLRWIEGLRCDGVAAPIRIGIPGPASIKTLLRFAAKCGVGASAKVMTKYGVSLTKLLNTAGPDALMAAFASHLDRTAHGEVRFHVYPFGGLKKAAVWSCEFG